VSGGGTRARAARRWLEPAGLFALAFAVRLAPWASVFDGGRVVPFDNDALYHLRRVAYALARFPEALGFDPYLHFPEGARAIWPAAFDWCVALALLPFAPALDAATGAGLEPVERMAAFVPPLLGAATAVALYRLARRELDRGVALAAALLLCVLPAHFWYSQLGFLDHHAAEAWSAVWLLGAGMGMLRAEPPEGGARVRGALRAVGAGLAAAACLLVWPGSLLHVALVEAGWLAGLVTRPLRGPAARLAASFAAANASAALAVVPFCGSAWPQWSAMSPVVLSGFQPWLFGTLALVGGACALAWRGRAAGGSAARRRASLAAASAVALAASLLAWPELREGAGEAWRWLARAEAFQSQVAESEPLLSVGGRFSLEVALRRLSLLGLLFPLLVAGLAWRVRRERERAPLFLLLAYGAALFAATLLQRRFFNALSAPLALLWAFGLCDLARSLPPHWLEGRARRRRARIAVAGLGLLLLAPALASYAPYLEQGRARLRGERPRLHPRQIEWRRMQEVAAWLARATPPTSGWLDATARPEYGVLAPWPLGHAIQYRGRRPTVVDSFGDDLGGEGMARAQRYFAGAEPEAAELLESLRVRYVVAGEGAGFLEALPGPDSMLVSLYLFDGSEPRALPPRGATAPPRALARHRLVYESGPLGPAGPPAYKVFELVQGARIAGRAAPGARVAASLALRTNRGRRIEFATSTRADAGGRYELRVPYATRGQPHPVRAGAAWALRCDGEGAAVAVDERAVRRGERVAGPDLCLAPAPQAL
jgi:dolichyl-diphosphooligosaccharide--protein glycosyltransferase